MKYYLLKMIDDNGNDQIKVYTKQTTAILWSKALYHCFKHKYKKRNKAFICKCKPYSITQVNERTIKKGKH